MKGFFISHPIKKSGDIPGRYPLESSVRALDSNGNCEENILFIHGDAYEQNMMAPNMDPCIFSDPLQWCWSYCRMTARGNSRQPNHNVIVDGTNLPTVVTNSRLLNSEVSVKDIIFFGNYDFNNKNKITKLWIDTVFVVGSKERWKVKVPKKGKKKELFEPPRFNDITIQSDIWKYHFEDHKYGHKHIMVDVPYYSFFASMYEQDSREFKYSYLPWVSDKELLCLTKEDLTSDPIKKLCTILEDSRYKVKQYDPRDLKRPILLNGDLAKSLWLLIGEKAFLRIVSVKPGKSVKAFQRSVLP